MFTIEGPSVTLLGQKASRFYICCTVCRELFDEGSGAGHTECLLQHGHHSTHYIAATSLNNVTRHHDFG
jgi:hypothetical protein